MQMVLTKIKYSKYKWPICSDLKMLDILLGFQLGNTKYPCYFCHWDSRARDAHFGNLLFNTHTHIQADTHTLFNTYTTRTLKHILLTLSYLQNNM